MEMPGTVAEGTISLPDTLGVCATQVKVPCCLK